MFTNRSFIFLRITILGTLLVVMLSPVLTQVKKAETLQTTQLKKIKVNGVELHYAEQGNGTPVIFVHGSLEDYRLWDKEVASFARNYRAIRYSRRYNYPNNNSKIESDHSAMTEAEDLAALIKKLKLKPVHIVGHSYGAYTALFLAVKHPELVRTLVLTEPPALGLAQDNSRGKVLFDEFMGNLWMPAAQAFNKNENETALRVTFKFFAGTDILDQLPATVRTDMMSNIREWRALTTSRNAFPIIAREDIKKIKVPVLMISGEQSLPILKFVDAELESLLTNKQRVIIQNASHDMWSEQPEAVREAALTFLNKH